MIAEKHGEGNILGIHFLGPNAGEVMQGFSVALRYELFDDQIRYLSSN